MIKRVLSIALSLVFILSICSTIASASVKDTAIDNSYISESKLSIDPNELSSEITDSLTDTAHPYILYSEDEIPELREKIKSGNSKKAFDRLMQTAEGYMNKVISVSFGSNGIVGRQLQAFVVNLSMASMLTDDDKYAKKAITLAISAAEQGNIEVYNDINGALCIADFGHAYALAYDCLYGYMTDEERTTIKNEIIEIGTWIYENSDPDDSDSWGADVDRRKAWNWNAVTHGALGLISLSLGDRANWLSLSIKRAASYFDCAVDDTGAGMEGLHYLGYGMNSFTPFDHAIYRLSGVEIMDDYPEMQKMPAWSMLYMTLPQGNAQAAIGQGSSMGNFQGAYYIINRYSLAEELWGFENTYGITGDNVLRADYEGDGWCCPSIILYEDQSLTPSAPTAENHPLYMEFDKGFVSARDSWEKDASMVTFTCGVGYAGCWNHPDDNSFTFSAKGDRFVIDLGAGRLESSEHNVVLIDGVGMTYVGGPTMRAGVLEEYKVLDNGNLYVRGNNITSYPKEINNSIRHLVYGDGETPFVLIYDYFRKDAQMHDYSINFYTDPNATVEISDNERYATITGANSGEKCYVIPMANDFVFLETGADSGANCLTTTATLDVLAQATLFIMAEPDGSMPDYDYNIEGKNCTVTITRTHNGEKITETYVFGIDRFVSFETDEILAVDPPVGGDNETSESETVTENETETTTTETETTSTSAEETTDTESETNETTVETTTETEIPTVTEPNSETEETATSESSTTLETSSTEDTSSAKETTPKSKDSGGCGAFASVSILPIIAIAATSATVIGKKKKH